MIRYALIFILSVAYYSSFCQKDNPFKVLIGKWTVTKIEVTYPDKKVTEQIEDTSYYEFSTNKTYTLTCKDLWGKAKIVGIWKPESTNKFHLFDITHISDVKGSLQTNGLGYNIELRKINKQTILFISSYDKELNTLHEIYYRKNE